MELFFRVCLFISGVINILPALLAFLPGKISNSYGIDLVNENYELLIRHRAVLFGIIGGIMIFSAIFKKYYDLSVVIGLVSMTSFVILYFMIGNINIELNKVFKIDCIGILVLLIGYIAFKFNS